MRKLIIPFILLTGITQSCAFLLAWGEMESIDKTKENVILNSLNYTNIFKNNVIQVDITNNNYYAIHHVDFRVIIYDSKGNEISNRIIEVDECIPANETYTYKDYYSRKSDIAFTEVELIDAVKDYYH